MKKLIYPLIFLLIIGCKKYEIISEVRENMYHLYHHKSKSIEIVITKDSLTKGESYRLREINIIPSPYYSTKRLKRKYRKTQQ